MPVHTQNERAETDTTYVPQDTGNLHGCPVSFLMGLPGTEVPEFGWIKPVLRPDSLVYIGLRDVDAGEKKILRDNSKSGPCHNLILHLAAD